MSRKLTAMLAAILAASALTSCGIGTGIQNDTTADETSSADTTAAETTSAQTETEVTDAPFVYVPDPLDDVIPADIVIPATAGSEYEVELTIDNLIPAGSCVYTFNFPMINRNTPGAKEANDLIMPQSIRDLHKLISGCGGKIDSSQTTQIIGDTAYMYAVRHGVVAVTVEGYEGQFASEYTPFQYGVYYDYAADKVISLEDYLSRFGLTLEDVAVGAENLNPGIDFAPDDIDAVIWMYDDYFAVYYRYEGDGTMLSMDWLYGEMKLGGH